MKKEDYYLGLYLLMFTLILISYAISNSITYYENIVVYFSENMLAFPFLWSIGGIIYILYKKFNSK